MPERADLLSTLPPDVRDDARRLYDELGRTVEQPDPRDVVAELHRRGRLDEGQLRDAVLALEGSLKVRSRDTLPPVAEAPRVLGRLGAGAMGEVLIAKDPGLNRVVAVKRLHPEGARRKALVRRFYKEAQVNAQLDHPSIVPIHGLVEDVEGGLAYAMKLVRGRTLEDYLQEARDQHERLGRPDREHALHARLERFLHVCDAIAYAHDRGVLHRDLKPENVMVGAFGEVLVMDWGIAKLLDHGDADEPEVGGPSEAAGPAGGRIHETRVGTVLGTPRYMSPEQAQGRNDTLDPRSDQYALGLILFEVVSLSPVMDLSLDLIGAVAWAATGRKQPLTHRYGDRVPRELAAIVAKATQRRRSLRYASVADMAEDIRRFLRDEAVEARPDNPVQRVARWIGHHRQLVMNLVLLLSLGFVAVTAVGAVGTVGAVAWLDHRAQVRERQATEVMQLVVHRARDIDAELYRLERLLHGLSFAAAHALEAPPPHLPWDPTVDAPPGRAEGARYEVPVAVDWPQIASVAAHPPRSEVQRLAGLGPRFARVLVDSAPIAAPRLDGDGRHALVADRGAPVVWARVATQDGLSATAPATGGLVGEAPDPRQQPWYLAVRGQRGTVWTGPTVDPLGQGVILTASTPIHDPEGRARGVASFDVSLAHLQQLVRAPEGAAGAWLLDAEGRVVVDQAADPRAAGTFEPRPLPWPEVLDAIGRARNGWIETRDGQLAVWGVVKKFDLTYLVIAPPELLVARTAEKRSQRAPG